MEEAIYHKARKVMDPKDISSHESDLYLKVTEQSEQLIKNYQFKGNVVVFRSQIDGSMWYDIPFAYEPYWEKKEKQSN